MACVETMNGIQRGESERKRDRFFARLRRAFAISLPDARGIVSGMHREMHKGLSGQRSSLRMLSSYVHRPDGTESGKYLSLDLGGTNCRVMEVALDGQRNAAVTAASRFLVPREVMRGDRDGLFDFLADCMGSFFRQHASLERRDRVLAFTFSFPMEQRSPASGTLIRWTKGFTVSGMEGMDVAELLQEAMARRRVGFVRLAALTNDTVGTLMAESYADASCDAGVILGTGTNACYPEKVARIPQQERNASCDEVIVNMEWGNFDGLKANRYDDLLDAASPNAGRQRLEKMVSGMYLGEIARLVIRDMRREGLLSAGADGAPFAVPYGWTTERLFSALHPDRPDDRIPVDGFSDLSAAERRAVCEVGLLVAMRSARIAASAIGAVMTWLDPELADDHTVAIDGSLYEKNPPYRDWVTGMTRMLFGKRAERIRPVLAKDGSGIGAAVVCAVASRVSDGPGQCATDLRPPDGRRRLAERGKT